MPALIERRRMRVRRDTLKLLLVAAVFAVGYFLYLMIQNHRAEAYFENLRQTDPGRYLDDLRKNEGFANYLDKYRLLEGYYVYKAAVPPFLVGRWTLKSAPERVAPGTVFADCKDPIVFEQGLIEVTTDGARKQYPVNYRISGQDVYLNGPDVLGLQVGLISYGAAIDHLELVPPGRSQKFYAYLCGN